MPGNGASSGWFGRLGGWLDIRLLLVGALLPDIIDKPLGHLLFRETFSNGRIFGHTLLFFVLAAGMACYLYHRRRQRWLLVLAAGTFVHLILDGMWHDPVTLFWPLLGLDFPRIELDGLLWATLRAMVSEPSVYIPELIGLAVLVWFGLWLVSRRMFTAFIRCGWVE